MRSGAELPRRASSTAARPMVAAATSVSMCPASAISAIEPIARAVVCSMAKNPVRITAAVIIRVTRAPVSV